MRPTERPQRRCRGRVIAIAALAGCALLLGLVPGTAGAFTAEVQNSQNTAQTAAKFTCSDTFKVTQNYSNAYFEYQLTSTSSSAPDWGAGGANTSGNGTYQGSHGTTAATATDACPADNAVAPNVYVLNGSNDAITTSGSISPPSSWTTAVWFKTTVATEPLIGFGGSSTGTNSLFDRSISLSAGKLVFKVRNSGGTNSSATSTAATYANGAWHHVVATMSPTAGMILYVDGTQVATNANKTVASTAGFWRIGASGLSTPTYFTGSMRFAAAYNTDLSALEIAGEYRNGT